MKSRQTSGAIQHHRQTSCDIGIVNGQAWILKSSVAQLLDLKRIYCEALKYKKSKSWEK